MDDLHKKIREFISGNIGSFHQRRLLSLQKLKLNDVLKRKNPYLFKAKNILQASDLVRTILDARLSSQEETIFGEFLEQLAIFISEESGGRKSSSQGIDLEMDRDGKRYVVSIKSGPNWGNSGQIRNMIGDFDLAKRIFIPTIPSKKLLPSMAAVMVVLILDIEKAVTSNSAGKPSGNSSPATKTSTRKSSSHWAIKRSDATINLQKLMQKS